ncbi:MAG TPA: hypothetical protein ENK18_16360 [Deltaproteobacteria bacterium]|nr:hypothetical protein [Deltaproteobacteria bacterium]
MAFKMRCPKCESFDYSVERDNRTFGAVAQAFELVYHCRCGKQMFGEQLVKEYERQKKAYESTSSASDVALDPGPPLEELEEVAELRGRLESRRRLVEDRQREAAEQQIRQREEEDRRWRARVQESSREVVTTPPPIDGAGVADQECAWPGCTKPRRSNSKYCTRACSNKNARARHKARQKKSKKSKSAAA